MYHLCEDDQDDTETEKYAVYEDKSVGNAVDSACDGIVNALIFHEKPVKIACESAEY